MMKYSVKATDSQGNDVALSIEASDKTTVAGMVRNRGLFPYKIQQELSAKQKINRVYINVIVISVTLVTITLLIYAATYNWRTYQQAIHAYRAEQYQDAVALVQKMSPKAQNKPTSIYLFSDSLFKMAQSEYENENYGTTLAHLKRIPNQYDNYHSVSLLIQNAEREIARIEEEASRRKAEEERRIREVQYAREQESKEQDRDRRIRRGFSFWSGSHRGVTDYIKKVLKDPKSYEHIETSYSDRGDHLIVKTRFRGRNSFGGMVVNTIVAKTDLDGNVLDVISFGE
jgi:hypothetical protein